MSAKLFPSTNKLESTPPGVLFMRNGRAIIRAVKADIYAIDSTGRLIPQGGIRRMTK
jgi:hypothetical protein